MVAWAVVEDVAPSLWFVALHRSVAAVEYAATGDSVYEEVGRGMRIDSLEVEAEVVFGVLFGAGGSPAMTLLTASYHSLDATADSARNM